MKLFNCFYIPAEYNEYGVRLREDALVLLIKKGHFQESELKIIVSPEIDFYVNKDLNDKKRVFSKDINELKKVTTKVVFKNNTAAKELGLLKEYRIAKQDGYKYNFIKNKIMGDPRIFLADLHVEDFYTIKYANMYGNNNYEIRKSFLDIEVRISENSNINTKTANNPISIISYVTSWDKQFHLFILVDRQDPQIEKIKNNEEEYLKWLSGEKDYGKDLVDDYNYNFHWYNSEIDMLIDFWKIFNNNKADFCGIWNIDFDVTYITNRMRRLKMNVLDHLCHPDFGKFKYIKYKKETTESAQRSNKHLSRLFHWFTFSNYTQFICCMSVYSNLRLRKTEKSYKLDSIALNELGYKKVNLLDKGYTLRDVEYKNFAEFVKYSAKDTIILDKLDNKSSDLINLTIMAGYSPIKNVFKNSIKLKSEAIHYLLQDKKIMSCNNNYNNSIFGAFESITGALVLNPALIKSKGLKLMGANSRIFEMVCDFDQKSQYPFIMIIWNIMKDTLYGKINSIIKNGEEVKDNGEMLNQMLLSIEASIYHIAKKYLNLPTIDELVKIFRNI